MTAHNKNHKITDERYPIKEELVKESEKLYIIFGGINTGTGMPPFEFCRASQILDESRIFVRDLSQSWYHLGLSGLTRDVGSTAKYLQAIIEQHEVKKTILVGNSMGGFAALLFASMIANDCRAIAFAPQTFISPIKRLKYRDHRWKSEIFGTYWKAMFKKKYFDLSNLEGIQNDWKGDIIVSADHKRDMAHALNMQKFSQVTIHAYDCDKHRIVKYLRDKGELQKILHENFNSNLKRKELTSSNLRHKAV